MKKIIKNKQKKKDKPFYVAIGDEIRLVKNWEEAEIERKKIESAKWSYR